MEIVYLMAGKRFQANNQKDLEKQLSQYSLTFHLGIRRLSDPIGFSRYDVVQAFGDSTDVQGSDVCIGKLIDKNGYNRPKVMVAELSTLEEALEEVKKDIPDAKILIGSYWS